MITIPWLEDLEATTPRQLTTPAGGYFIDTRAVIEQVQQSVVDRSMTALSYGKAFDVDMAAVFAADFPKQHADPFSVTQGRFVDLLPDHEKAEWVLQHLGPTNKLAMADDLFRTAIDVCRHRDLRPLESAVLSWEATAEEVADADEASIRDDGESDTPMSIEEVRQRLVGE